MPEELYKVICSLPHPVPTTVNWLPLNPWIISTPTPYEVLDVKGLLALTFFTMVNRTHKLSRRNLRFFISFFEVKEFCVRPLGKFLGIEIYPATV